MFVKEISMSFDRRKFGSASAAVKLKNSAVLAMVGCFIWSFPAFAAPVDEQTMSESSAPASAPAVPISSAEVTTSPLNSPVYPYSKARGGILDTGIPSS